MENPLHCYKSQIAFADTDASGWLHFPNIFRYVEAAEHECLTRLGLLVFAREQGGWPRVSVSCDYKKPFVNGDAVEVQLKVAEIGTTSLRWQFEVFNDAGELAAAGEITVVRVNQFGKPQVISDEEREALSRE